MCQQLDLHNHQSHLSFGWCCCLFQYFRQALTGCCLFLCSFAILSNFGTGASSSASLVLQPCALTSPASAKLPALHWLLCFASACSAVLVHSCFGRLTFVLHSSFDTCEPFLWSLLASYHVHVASILLKFSEELLLASDRAVVPSLIKCMGLTILTCCRYGCSCTPSRALCNGPRVCYGRPGLSLS